MTVIEPIRVDDGCGHPDDDDRIAPAEERAAAMPRTRALAGGDAATFARTLFRISFRSAMSDEDAQRLHDALDMTLHLHSKHPAVRPPLGVAPLPFGGRRAFARRRRGPLGAAR